MTELETRILDLLRKRKGHKLAIRAKTIATLLGVSEREVRDAIKTLIEQYNHPIASTVEPPYGFFIPASQEEIEQYAQNLKSRIKSIAVRLRAFEANTAHRVLEQLELGI